MFRSLFTAKPEARDLTFSDIWKRGLDLTDASTTAGERVNSDTALGLSAVFGAVRLLSDTISTLPVDVFFRQRGVEQQFRPLPEWITQMNPMLRNHEVIGQIMMSLLLDGNSYVATLRDRTGRVLTISPLDPSDITPEVVTVEGRQELIFRSAKQPSETYTSYDIQHLRGLMKPGSIKGLSPISAAREMIGLALGAQRYGATFFGSSGLAGATIEVPGQLTPEGVEALKASWNAVHRSASNANKIAVLTEGAKFSKISIPPEDSQFLETKKSSVADIARIFGVPPHLLADSQLSTSWGSGLHEQNVAFSMYSLRPYITRIEHGMTSILRSSGISVAYAKLDVASLSRGTSERWGNYQQGILNGVYSIDEVRALEGLPPLPDGEGQTHYRPLNLVPVGQEFNEEQ